MIPAVPPPLPFEKRTVFGPSGNGDLGAITEAVAAAVGCSAGAIRLLNGVQGRAGGFGLAHIESYDGRVDQFAALGHRTAFHYVRFVASGYEAVALQADGRLILLRRDASYSHHVICQWDEDLGFWSVTTAIPKRAERNLNILWGKAWGDDGKD